jgi:NTP pyrophosphatase (non-canonical NTP hydrolase)
MLEEKIQRIIEWGQAKGIMKKENSFKQLAKMTEETGEVASALFRDNLPLLEDAIGDQFITAVILAEQNGLMIEDCIETALQVIENRKTKTIDGKVMKVEEV